MPRKGFHSITLNDHMYDELHHRYTQRKKQLNKIGVNSIASLTGRIVHNWLYDYNDKPLEDALNDEKHEVGK